MKDALAGVDVVICTIAAAALGLQVGIAKAAKEAGVKLFVPSEFGGVKASPEETEGFFGQKVGIRHQLGALGLPYTIFHTGIYSDYIWRPCASLYSIPSIPFSQQQNRLLELDITNGKVTVGGDGNRKIAFTSRTDIARYVSYVLTHLPAEQLENRAFELFGDTKVNEFYRLIPQGD
jgi:uncharacterized protein YbjT (DUF2867 family)